MHDSNSPAAPQGYRTILVILVAATFTVILNETIMMNALPVLMEHFEVDARSVQWLSTAFMLTMAVIIPTTGWFLQRVSTRVAFGLAMGVFLAGTLLAALAWSFPVLVVARVIQAGGTAIMMPLLMTTLMMVVPEKERGSVMGSVTLAISVAPAMGPTVSGLAIELTSWRGMFWVVFPIAGAMTLLGMRYLPNVESRRAASIDVPSVVVSAIGFGFLVYGLSQIGAEGVRPPIDPSLAITIGVVGIVVFVLRQLQLQRSDRPLLDLRTLTSREYTLSLALLGAAFMAMLGVMLLLPIYLQDVRGVSVLHTGLLMMPGGLVMGFMGPLVGRLFDRHGARVLVVPGAVVIVAALTGFTQITTSTSVWTVMGLHTMLLSGMAFAITPLFTVALASLPRQLYSHGSSLLGTMQQLAAAAGAALVVTVMSSRALDLARQGESVLQATAGGMRSAFWFNVAVGLITVALAVFLPGRNARRPQPKLPSGTAESPEPTRDVPDTPAEPVHTP